MVQLTINFARKLGGIAIGPNGFDLMIVIIESNSSMIPFPTRFHSELYFSLGFVKSEYNYSMILYKIR